MPLSRKHRFWQAFLSISASGPEFSPALEDNGRFLRSRMAADLECTTADVDYLEGALCYHDDDRPIRDELHLRLRNPSKDEVRTQIAAIERWLSRFKNDKDWDGGVIQLCFAGHGREADGALVFSDGDLTPHAFVDALVDIAKRVSRPGRLRVSVILDSCHSGAFVTTLLDLLFNHHHEWLVPFNLFGSCMHDEFAWEDSSLGHGLFTYCASVRQTIPASLTAHAVQPDNSIGPSLAIARGEMGCALLTAGAQNPVSYWNGTGHLEVSRRDINLRVSNDQYLNESEMRDRLVVLRNELRDILRPLRRDILHFEDGMTDDDMRKSIHEDLAFIQSLGKSAQTKQTENPR